jgi:hypothetical protein
VAADNSSTARTVFIGGNPRRDFTAKNAKGAKPQGARIDAFDFLLVFVVQNNLRR